MSLSPLDAEPLARKALASFYFAQWRIPGSQTFATFRVNAMAELDRALAEAGFTLREGRHRVWRHPSGAVVVQSANRLDDGGEA